MVRLAEKGGQVGGERVDEGLPFRRVAPLQLRQVVAESPHASGAQAPGKPAVDHFLLAGGQGNPGVERLVAGYGAAPVVDGISVEAAAGQIVTLVGANGAGKSTLLKALAGALPVRSGRVFVGGEDVTSVPAHRRVGTGIVLVPEGRMLFPGMSVDENLTLGAYLRRGSSGRRATEQDRQRVFELFPVLEARKGQAAGTLSG